MSELLYDHIVRYLGNPVSREIFRQTESEPMIQILRFKNVFPGCEVFCSFGASHYMDVLGGPAEVILPCDNAGRLLANALFYMVQNDMNLGRGVGIKLERLAPDFSRKFGKTAIYFTNPFGLPPEFSIVNLGSKTGRMYVAFFISGAEFEYFCDRGAQEFESLLENADVDPFEVNRPSVI